MGIRKKIYCYGRNIVPPWERDPIRSTGAVPVAFSFCRGQMDNKSFMDVIWRHNRNSILDPSLPGSIFYARLEPFVYGAFVAGHFIHHVVSFSSLWHGTEAVSFDDATEDLSEYPKKLDYTLTKYHVKTYSIVHQQMMNADTFRLWVNEKPKDIKGESEPFVGGVMWSECDFARAKRWHHDLVQLYDSIYNDQIYQLASYTLYSQESEERGASDDGDDSYVVCTSRSGLVPCDKDLACYYLSEQAIVGAKVNSPNDWEEQMGEDFIKTINNPSSILEEEVCNVE